MSYLKLGAYFLLLGITVYVAGKITGAIKEEIEKSTEAIA